MPKAIDVFTFAWQQEREERHKPAIRTPPFPTQIEWFGLERTIQLSNVPGTKLFLEIVLNNKPLLLHLLFLPGWLEKELMQ